MNDGGTAFPAIDEGHFYEGMSLRDWFAGQALQQFAKAVMEKHEHEPDKTSSTGDKSTTYFFDSGTKIDPEYADYISRAAYTLADAMLAAREGKS